MRGVILTDIGGKDVNQDNACIKETGNYLLAAVCDGMGGYTGGEVASDLVISAFSWWFDNVFAKHPEQFSLDDIQKEFTALIEKTNRRLVEYGKRCEGYVGTTLSAMLLTEDQALAVQVGDTRIYSCGSKITLMTEDQSFAHSELASGRMSEEEISKDSRRHMLLQCIGITDEIHPVYRTWKRGNEKGYILCSDGFWQTADMDDMNRIIHDAKRLNEDGVSFAIQRMIEEIKQNGETDNITAAAIWNSEDDVESEDQMYSSGTVKL